MPVHETSDAERIEEVIVTSVRQILEHQDGARYLSWARDHIPAMLGLGEAGLEPEEEGRLAISLATAIWNATPLPGEGYRVRPLPQPTPESQCPCGSGLEYAACCQPLGDAPELPPELIWGVLLGELSDRQLQEAVAGRSLPLHMLSAVSERWLDEDRPGRAASLLEPIFDSETDVLDDRFDAALNVLCDAYDRLDHIHKKRNLLDRVTRSGPPVLRATAWQRLSTIHIDDGEFPKAEAAFTQALREDPDSPRNAILEITLLAAQHKEALARQRADFWRRRLTRKHERDPELLAFLGRAAEDPQDALVASQAAAIDPMLLRLRDWTQAAAVRPLPAYRLGKSPRGSQPVAADQLSLFDGETLPARRVPVPPHWARLCAPAALSQLETAWHQAFSGSKPFSIQLDSPHGEEVWESDRWLQFLERHPEAADSLDVIDDVATALYVHPESSLPWIARVLLLPLVQRARQILEKAVSAEDSRVMPWVVKENRAALRLLFRLFLLQEERGDATGAAATMEDLLRLNPDDNHGVRAELMNHYLRHREDQRALELASRFPNDLLADLAYGEVLALYRMGQKEHAERALTRAVGRLPRIPHYLTRKRVRQPALRPDGVRPGDDDQAWLYREAMRDVWAAEPGVLAWLKKQTA